MSLPIVHYNEPVLRSKGEQVIAFDGSLARLASEMIATMHAAGGIGLAAQQVGRALQLCVVDLRDAEKEFNWELNGARPPLELFMPLVLANPQLTITPGTPETVFEEGCLSFPNIRGNVARRDALTVRFQDQRGLPHVLTCDGLLARCIQHEVDHLQGVLFIQRMDAKTRSSVDEPVKSLAKATRAEKKKHAAACHGQLASQPARPLR
ncbi:MAG: peptide deformylase [Opitutus sp.]|nr:peptide deformylase [Opitutus sp.]